MKYSEQFKLILLIVFIIMSNLFITVYLCKQVMEGAEALINYHVSNGNFMIAIADNYEIGGYDNE